jgi:hypothetical protein
MIKLLKENKGGIIMAFLGYLVSGEIGARCG